MTKIAGKKKELVPRLRFPEFRKTGGWNKKEFRQFLQESRIKGSPGDVAKKLTVKLWGNGVFGKIETLKGSANTSYFRRKAGQFIYSKLDFLNQAFGIIPHHLDGFESTVDLPCFDVSGEIHSGFLLEYVKRSEFYKKFGESADGGRKAKRIQSESFLSFPISVPFDFLEQQKIAECLCSLDDLIRAESEMLEAIKVHKKGLMQGLFPIEGETVPRLRLPEFCKAKAWSKRKISDMLIKKAFPVELKLGNMYQEIGIRSHGKGIFHKVPLSGEALGEKRVFKVVENALILNIVFAWEQAVATTSREEAGMIASHRFPMYVPGSDDCDVRFIKYVFLTPWGKHQLGLASPGGAGRNRTLGQDEFEKLELTLPNKDEQTKIADVIRACEDRISVQTLRIEALKSYKEGLMQQLFPAPVQAKP